MNKSITIAIAVCLILGIALILASKIPQAVLFGIGLTAVILGILMTGYILYQNFKGDKR